MLPSTMFHIGGGQLAFWRCSDALRQLAFAVYSPSFTTSHRGTAVQTKSSTSAGTPPPRCLPTWPSAT